MWAVHPFICENSAIFKLANQSSIIKIAHLYNESKYTVTYVQMSIYKSKS